MSDHVVAKAVPIDSAKKSQMAEVVAPATLGEGKCFCVQRRALLRFCWELGSQQNIIRALYLLSISS